MAGEFVRLHRPVGPTGFVVRPDGYLRARFPLADAGATPSGRLRRLSASWCRSGSGRGQAANRRPAAVRRTSRARPSPGYR
ncbi:hypothetical protein B1H29_01935 [Streptomyces pactum]|uniref:Uncharacterized protein n=1 Tax=Streptomyces pactum TaxID=68249 RepID=A0A1S6J294_9ACTN|nr:hypothetical protein B1H29_01935 [Streptomyces pactum]